MEIQHEANMVYRCIPRENTQVNKYWMCDEGRFNYTYVQDADRVTEPAVRQGSSLNMQLWKDSVLAARSAVQGKKVAVLIGSDLTQEEAKLIQEFVPQKFAGASIFHFGTPGIHSAAQDDAADALLKRKSKTSNLHGMEKLGIQGFQSLPAGTDAVLVFRGGRAELPQLSGVTAIGIGVFKRPEAEGFQAILPGAAFSEKDGTIVNFLGMEQRLKRAITPPRECKSVSEILMMWANL